jgi:LysM repeat protein
MKLLSHAVVLLLMAAVLSCSSDSTALNDDNDYYKSALGAKKRGDYQGAAQTFLVCLKKSPNSHKAHLQLALLYEDHLNKLPSAIHHYQAYIDSETNVQLKTDAGAWKMRAEKKLYVQLKSQYDVSDPEPALSFASENKVSPDTSVPPADAAPKLETRKPSGLVLSPITPDDELPVVVDTPKPAVKIPDYAAKKKRYYVVKVGDSLAKISKKVYGRSSDWNLIFQANRSQLPTPEKLKIGQRLHIPERR